MGYNNNTPIPIFNERLNMCMAHAQMGGPIWVLSKPILPCGYHCNAHVL
jgi:hypothetical protein